jgi:hypothetical protein
MKNIISSLFIIITSMCVYTHMYAQDVYNDSLTTPVFIQTSEIEKIGENYYQIITRYVGDKVWYEEKKQFSNFPEIFVTPLLMLQKSEKAIKKIKNVQFIKRSAIPFNTLLFHKRKHILFHNWDNKSKYAKIY